MKKFFSDFKAFIMRGNVIDMAVGVVVGGAFSKIVSSLVKDILTPLISLITGNGTFSESKLILKEGVTNELGELTGEIALTYGVFIQTIIDFFIIAISIFFVLRIAMNTQKRFEAIKNSLAKKDEPEVEENAEEAKEVNIGEETLLVLKEIRDFISCEKKVQDENFEIK